MSDQKAIIIDDDEDIEAVPAEVDALDRALGEEPLPVAQDASTGSAEPEPESEGGRFVADNAKVRLADGTVTTVADLKAGGMRQSDYTRKAQVVAAERKELQLAQARVAVAERALAAERDWTGTVLAAMLPQSPDIRLLDQDERAYHIQKANYDNWMETLRALYRNWLSAQEREKAASEAEQQATFVAETGRALEEHPELSSNEDAINALFRILPVYGFTKEDLTNGFDARFIRVMKDLTRLRQIQDGKEAALKKVEGKPLVTPSRRQAVDDSRPTRRDWNRLKQSGGRDEAALDRILDKYL